MPVRCTLLNIVDKINTNYKTPYRITVKHAKCNGYYKPVLYKVLAYDKIREIHPILGTSNSYSGALVLAIEYYIYYLKQNGKDFIN